MKLARSLNIVIISVLGLSLGCKTRDSQLKTLGAGDVRAILEGAQEHYDQNVEKLMIFVVSEDVLSDQGHGFFDDYRLLIQNHLGTKYKIITATSGQPQWVAQLGRDDDGFAEKILMQISRMSVNDLASVVNKVKETYRNPLERKVENPDKKLQIFLHVLAHGHTTTGTGEGGVAIGGELLEFRELADKLLNPLAELADELLAVVEPCFGGNISWNLRQNFYIKNNALVVFGAPPWASQWASSSESTPLSGASSSPLQKRFIRSPGTISLKKALMGYASDFKDNRPVAFSGGQTLDVFEGTSLAGKLQEKHVVRVDEFKKYVEANGTLTNCEYALSSRRSSAGSLCRSESFSGSNFSVGIGIKDEPDLVKRKIAEIMSQSPSRESFVQFMTSHFPIHQVHVATSFGNTHTLNPEGGNGILSVVNFATFEDQHRRAVTAEGLGSFSAYETHSFDAVQNSLSKCVADIQYLSGDLFEILSWLLPNQSPPSSGSQNTKLDSNQPVIPEGSGTSEPTNTGPQQDARPVKPVTCQRYL